VANRYYPKTQQEIYEAIIAEKRSLVNAGSTSWTSEESGDFGIGILTLVSYALGDSEAFIDNRLKQAFLVNASDPESVYDGARSIGYRPQGLWPASVLVVGTSTDDSMIASGEKLVKDLEDGTEIVFEANEDVVFVGAETKKFYCTQGDTHTVAKTSDGTANQKFYLSRDKVVRGTLTLSIGGVFWSLMDSWVNSTPSSTHFLVEMDYRGRPIILLGDGYMGLVPPSGSQITLTYRTCSGNLGNVAPGVMRSRQRHSNIASLTNKSPATCELDTAVTPFSAIVSVTDDGSIDAFADSGIAYLDNEDSFSYTGKSGATFTGVTGITRSHPVGVDVSYTIGQTVGEDVESTYDVRLNALQSNRLKTSANSLIEYAYLARKVPGVVRAVAYNHAHTTFLQLVPYHAGIPEPSLLAAVEAYITPRMNARHSLNIMSPSYAYVDVTAVVTPFPGLDFDNVVRERVQTVLQYYLNPLSKSFNGSFYTSLWGRKLKVSELTYVLLYILGGRTITNVSFTTFKRSTEVSGSDDIDLLESEIANVGTIYVQNSEDIVPIEDLAGDIGFRHAITSGS